MFADPTKRSMAESGIKKETAAGQSATLSVNDIYYRVGDYVYFENFPSTPYYIRRIEELNKTANDTVEVKVVCLFRRRDLPSQLLRIADKAERQQLYRPRRSLITRKNQTALNGVTHADDGENGVSELSDCTSGKGRDGEESGSGLAGLPRGADALSTEDVHRLRQHELFLSRQVDTLPATQIRGKCAVVMLSEVETSESYLGRDDSFFYSLVFDATNQTLLADKGRIDVGERHQADVPEMLTQAEIDRERGVLTTVNGERDDDAESGGGLRIADDEEEEATPIEVDGVTSAKTDKTTAVAAVDESSHESIVYHPHHDLTDRDIDQFLIIARAVGTFSRALDVSSTIKLPSLHMTAAAASRDVALFHAMALLHQANYDIGQAVKYLVPPPQKENYPLEADKSTGHNTVRLGGPILCRDQLEEWSAAEATLFEEAIEKCGKDFHDIRAECLPWKSIRDIVEYYYQWKTTARHADRHRPKLIEEKSKLKQVYIPSYNKPNPNLVGPTNASGELVKSISPCESCKADESLQWYSWGPAHLQLRLCKDCWLNWKKHGGLKRPHEYEAYDLDGAADMSLGARGPNSRGNSQRTANGTVPKLAASSQFYQGKDRHAFYLSTTLQMRIARGLAPKKIFNIRKAARSPNKPVDTAAILNNYFGREIADVLRSARLIKTRSKERGALPAEAAALLTHIHRTHNIAPTSTPTPAAAAAVTTTSSS